MSAAVAAAAAGAPAGAAGAAPGAPPAAAQGWSLSSLFRMLMFYWMVSSFFKGSAPAKEVKDVSTGVIHYPHRNAWPEHTPYSLYVFVHDAEELNINLHTAATLNPRSLIWFESGLKYGWDPVASEAALNWTMSSDSWPLHHLHANGTLYAHAYFVKDHTPLFQWRAIGDVAGEDAYTNTHDAVVPSSGSSAVSAGKTGTAAPELLTLPSDTSSPEFTARYLRNAGFNAGNIVHRVMNLNIYSPAPKKIDKKNLLGVGAEGKANASKELEVKPVETTVAEEAEQQEEEEEEFMDFETGDDDEFSGGVSTSSGNKRVSSKSTKKQAGAPWVSYWKPFLSLRLIPDWTVFPYGGIPAEMVADYRIDPRSDAYDPPIYFDYFWLLKDQLVAINSSVSELSLNLTHSPLSLMKWRLETQMETSWKMQASWGMQEEDGRDSEMFKRMVMDTNIYLLVITFAVSILHMVFDFLAFKNDVKFWKETKSMRGLSTRTILVNIVTQAIIFLYLLDNDTSYMILLSSGVGIVIEGWKASKAFVFKYDASKPLRDRLRILNKSMSEDKKEEEKSEEEKEMELHASYDAEAMRYLSYALYPFVVCYAIYSLYYEDHKSWYSFVLAVLTGCVYTGGFIMMTPQLYMNYKLKSVAHLPWRMLTYKALNTFIDDLFAFVITMPTLHRLSCFRDDLIFFIFLYQKWSYRTDYKRINEFGAAFISPEEQAKIEEEDRIKRQEEEQKKSAEIREKAVENKKAAAAAASSSSSSAESALGEESEDAASSSASDSTLRQRAVNNNDVD